MNKGNEEGTPKNFNRDKIRITTICTQEALSPKNKNIQFLKSDSQQAPSELISINNFGLLRMEKEMFLYDFEEGMEFQEFYPHNNFREVLNKLMLVKINKSTDIKTRKPKFSFKGKLIKHG